MEHDIFTKEIELFLEYVVSKLNDIDTDKTYTYKCPICSGTLSIRRNYISSHRIHAHANCDTCENMIVS